MSLDQLRSTYPLTRVSPAGFDVEVIRTHGPGRPLLLLPGAQGTAEVFLRQLLAWGDCRDLVAITYPGLTDSQRLAEVIAGVASALGLEHFDLLGSSLGGYLAQRVALQYPGRVGRLVVGNSFHDPGPLQSPDKLAGLQAKRAEEVQQEALARLQAQPPSEFRQVMLDLVGQRQSAETLRSRMLAVQLATALPPLPLPQKNMLLIECDNDPLIAPPVRAALRAHYADAAHAEIMGGGHYPHLLQTEAYNAVVASFLSIP